MRSPLPNREKLSAAAAALAGLLAFAVPGRGLATTADDLDYCGGYGQRACCLLEAVPSCDQGLSETGAIAHPTVCGGFPAGTCGGASPDALPFCGGDRQRACCVGESPLGNPCDTGAIELGAVGGACAYPALAVGADAGTCWKRTPCGGAGERACSVLHDDGRPACAEGLIELGGCRDLDCGPSSGWCYRPTPCGGEGQRACCLLGDIKGPPGCAAGLREIPGASGDFSCGIGDLIGNGTPSLSTCASADALLRPIAEPAAGWSATGATDQTCAARGYADLHAHLFADLGHGGGVLAGEPYAPGGINAALRQDFGSYRDLVAKDGADLLAAACDPTLYPDCGTPGFLQFHGAHTLTDHALGAGTREGLPLALGLVGAGSHLGAPLFNGWPTWRSTTHQQMYYKWLERAWRGGLRLMVQLAVTNEALCKSSKRLRHTDCEDEMAPVDAQLQATWALQDVIDAAAGGAGMGWFRVVTTPAAARQAIRDGKLAVVLGIEVANLFNCKRGGCSGKNAGESDAAYVDRKIDEYYDKGVRVIFPIHNFDNAFGGPATWQDAIHAGNYVSEGSWWDAEQCPDAYGFRLGGFTPFIINLFGFGELVVPLIDPNVSVSCNRHGLTPLGDHMIRSLMRKGIVVDVDHMSNHAFDAALDIAGEEARPVIASHVQFYELMRQEKRHERMRTRPQLERIRDSGGMVAAMLKDDKQDTDDVGGKWNLPYVPPSGKGIADDCRHSSKTWAQMYQYASDVMGGPVAMGSDFNGVAGHVGPRFGFDACGQDAEERSIQGRAGNALGYPFTLPGFGTFEKQTTGLKTFDFNVDGLAHVGLLPDLVADLGRLGLGASDLEPLWDSAIGFVDVWARAAGDEPSGGSTTRLGCEDRSVSADATCRAAGISIADAATAAAYEQLVQAPAGPYLLGGTSVTLSTTQTDACGAQPESCNAVVTVRDTTAPGITCPAAVAAECAGAGTPVAFGSPVAGSDNCGPATLTGCNPAAGGTFAFGTTTVTCGVRDAASPTPNVNTCSFPVTVRDTTPPTITCPGAITRECTSPQGASVTPGAATGADVCGGISVSTQAARTFPLGTTALSYTATDAVGLTATCSSDVIVRDTTPPAVICPDPVVAECTGNQQAAVTPGAASASDLCGAAGVTSYPTASYPLGTTPLTFVATDGAGLTAACESSVTVRDTTPPTISCPADVVRECEGPHGARVTPGSAVASDVCGDVAVTSHPSADFALGTTTLPYVATDGVHLTARCSGRVTVQDTTPPAIAASTATPAVLWPPNHKMVPIALTVDSRDLCSGQPGTCAITGVRSNEPEDGRGDGATAADWMVTGPLALQLRAERSGTGRGRTYTIDVACRDAAGNASTTAIAVTVPHNQ
ncbi:HYR domain-containing protein [bacterium]|nr:HYR domain-containing protein [bacterium]